MKLTKVVPLLGFFLLVTIIWAELFFLVKPLAGEWYYNLIKPSWQPPGWVLEIVWVILYPLLAISGWLAWRKLVTYETHEKFIHPIITPYWIQLLLLFSWSMIFFGLQNPLLAFIDIIVLIIAVILNIIMFRTVDKISAYMLILYLAWLIYAASINLGIIILNYK